MLRNTHTSTTSMVNRRTKYFHVYLLAIWMFSVSRTTIDVLSFIHNVYLNPSVHISSSANNSTEFHFTLTSLQEYHILQAMQTLHTQRAE